MLEIGLIVVVSVVAIAAVCVLVLGAEIEFDD